MSRLQDFSQFYSDVQFELPKALKKQYEVLSVLGEKENKTIVLIEDRESREKYVLKIVNGIRPELGREYEALKQFKTEHVVYSETDRKEYLIRPYIEGISLEQYIENEGVMDYHQAVVLLKNLCDRISEMQADGANMIHRDIKPANIILTPGGGVELIDFECARTYDETKTKDTMFVGTIDTAAPEQYGYAQSDERTDIYAIGKTLGYAMTESYDMEAVKKSKIPMRMKHIIKKCVRFDPARRYQSAEELRDAVSGKKLKRSLVLAASICALCLAVAIGGRVLYERQAVDFASETLEAAVRAELDRPRGDVLRSDLKKVRRLAVVGDQTFSRQQKYVCRIEDYIDEQSMYDRPRGDIADLKMLCEMPNLEEVYLCMQEIEDISPLKSLGHLRILALTNNHIRDISPLADRKGLTELYIGVNPVESYEPLRNLTNLYELNLDREMGFANKCTEVPSLEPISALSVHRLSLGGIMPVEGGFSAVGELEELEYLFLWNPKEEYLAQLAKAPRLNDIFLGGYVGESLEGLAEAKNLSTLSLHDGFHTIAGVEKIKNLTELRLSYGIGIDLAPLSEAENLRCFYIRQMHAEGYAVLARLPALEIVEIDPHLKKRFLEECPDFDFELKDIK